MRTIYLWSLQARANAQQRQQTQLDVAAGAAAAAPAPRGAIAARLAGNAGAAHTAQTAIPRCAATARNLKGRVSATAVQRCCAPQPCASHVVPEHPLELQQALDLYHLPRIIIFFPLTTCLVIYSLVATC